MYRHNKQVIDENVNVLRLLLLLLICRLILPFLRDFSVVLLLLFHKISFKQFTSLKYQKFRNFDLKIERWIPSIRHHKILHLHQQYFQRKDYGVKRKRTPQNFILSRSDVADEHNIILLTEEPSNQHGDMAITARRCL